MPELFPWSSSRLSVILNEKAPGGIRERLCSQRQLRPRLVRTGVQEVRQHLCRYMGAYRPHFKSIPQDHYPPSWWDVILCTLILVVVVVGGLGLMIGFLIWDFVCGSTDFVLVWSIVLCVFTGIILLGVFIGGRAKISN